MRCDSGIDCAVRVLSMDQIICRCDFLTLVIWGALQVYNLGQWVSNQLLNIKVSTCFGPLNFKPSFVITLIFCPPPEQKSRRRHRSNKLQILWSLVLNSSCAHTYTKHTQTICSRRLAASRYCCISPGPSGVLLAMSQSMGSLWEFFLYKPFDYGFILFRAFHSLFLLCSHLHQRLSSTLDSEGSCLLAAISSTRTLCATRWPPNPWPRCFSRQRSRLANAAPPETKVRMAAELHRVVTATAPTIIPILLQST